MRVLGIDIGMKRTGLALSDELGLSISLLPNLYAPNQKVALEKICSLVHEFGISVIVIGLPEGRTEHSKAVRTRAIGLRRALEANGVEQGLSLKIVLFDEAYSSKNAVRTLVMSGVPKKKRQEKLDAAAAAYLVEQYLLSASLE
jgi:putative Holliday junction resolvase